MTFFQKHFSKLRYRFFNWPELINNRNALRNLRSNEKLWTILADYLQLTKSTGCRSSTYWELYKHIRKYKPAEVLECGTGVSTVVMAYGLLENEKEGNNTGRITSMEDNEEWYETAVKLMPMQLKKYVDFVYSKKEEYCYSIFRGIGYRDIPNRKYEFVFIDGPGTLSPSDGTRSFDFDIINIVMKSDRPVFGIIDTRMGTCYVLQKVFGVDNVKYDPKCCLGFMGPYTKNDLRSTISNESFSHRLRFFGKNELNLRMGLTG